CQWCWPLSAISLVPSNPGDYTPRIMMTGGINHAGALRPATPFYPDGWWGYLKGNGGSGTGPVLLEAQEAEAVEDDEDRREGHGRPGDHRIQQAQSRDRNRRRVVGEGPEQVALDEAEGSAREPDGLWDLPRIGLDHGDVRGGHR